jgi:hypothetical protein
VHVVAHPDLEVERSSRGMRVIERDVERRARVSADASAWMPGVQAAARPTGRCGSGSGDSQTDADQQ